jgi:hypothetical protein
MLELGNKVNPQVGVSYKDWFTPHCNIEHVSVDVNGLNGALALDLRQPLTAPRGACVRHGDLISARASTWRATKHCVWKNMWDHLAVGGHLVSITPLAGDWHWHGSLVSHRGIYDAFAYRNDMAVVPNWVSMARPPRRCQFLVARKLQRSRAFVYSRNDLLYRNAVSQARVTARGI